MRRKLILRSEKTNVYLKQELESGRTAVDLAQEFNVAPSTLYAYMLENRITYCLTYPRGINEALALEVIDYVKLNPNKTNQQIQQHFDISYYMLKQVLDIHGIHKQKLRIRNIRWTHTQQEVVRVYNQNTCESFANIARTVGTTRMTVSRVIRKYTETGVEHGDSRQHSKNS